MLIKAGIGAVMTAAIVGTTLQIALPPRPKILYNPSSSAPIGWYQVIDNYAPKRNDLVAAYAPDWARKLADERSYLPYEYPLIKSVLAIEGDEVCYHIDRVSVPNGAGEIWIASSDVQAGFDSRYFGPINLNMLIGGVEYLGNGRVPKRRRSVGFEG